MNSAEENVFVKRKCNASIKSFLMYLRDNPHNNLPIIVEVGEDDYVMEYINGMTLSEYAEKEDISFMMARDFILQLLNAVEVLHKFNIVHRDINPDNIVISTDGTLKLIDFDIAREIVKNKARDTQILGTIGYAAPEQFGFTQTDERSDIYAIGVVYKFMVDDILDEKEHSHSQVRKIITKCIQIDQNMRYKNVSLLRRDIKLFRFTSYHIFDIIPGFRTGNIYKMIFACSAYFILFFGYVWLIFSEMPRTNILDIVGFMAVVIIYIVYSFLFFAVGTNFLNLADRIKLPFKKRWKKQVFVMVVMCILGSLVGYAVQEGVDGLFLGNPIFATASIYIHLLYSIIYSIVSGML